MKKIAVFTILIMVFICMVVIPNQTSSESINSARELPTIPKSKEESIDWNNVWYFKFDAKKGDEIHYYVNVKDGEDVSVAIMPSSELDNFSSGDTFYGIKEGVRRQTSGFKAHVTIPSDGEYVIAIRPSEMGSSSTVNILLGKGLFSQMIVTLGGYLIFIGLIALIAIPIILINYYYPKSEEGNSKEKKYEKRESPNNYPNKNSYADQNYNEEGAFKNIENKESKSISKERNNEAKTYKNHQTSGNILGKCPDCGTQIEDDWKVCPMCKTKLTKECPECGKHSKLAFEVCPYCGYEFIERSLEENELIVGKLKRIIERCENGYELNEEDIHTIKENLESNIKKVRYYALLAATYIAERGPSELISEIPKIKTSFKDEIEQNRVNSTFIIVYISRNYPNKLTSITNNLIPLLYDESETVQINASESILNISKVSPEEFVDKEDEFKKYIEKKEDYPKETIKNIKKTLKNIKDRPMPW